MSVVGAFVTLGALGTVGLRADDLGILVELHIDLVAVVDSDLDVVVAPSVPTSVSVTLPPPVDSSAAPLARCKASPVMGPSESSLPGAVAIPAVAPVATMIAAPATAALVSRFMSCLLCRAVLRGCHETAEARLNGLVRSPLALGRSHTPASPVNRPESDGGHDSPGPPSPETSHEGGSGTNTSAGIGLPGWRRRMSADRADCG